MSRTFRRLNAKTPFFDNTKLIQQCDESFITRLYKNYYHDMWQNTPVMKNLKHYTTRSRRSAEKVEILKFLDNNDYETNLMRHQDYGDIWSWD